MKREKQLTKLINSNKLLSKKQKELYKVGRLINNYGPKLEVFRHIKKVINFEYKYNWEY